MIKIPLNNTAAIIGKYANRHGLIAGATGTGKTVTLQKLAESFSKAGTPVFIADIKGDIAGLAIPGAAQACPVAFFDVFRKQGAPLQLTVESLGVDLLARILEISDAQKGFLELALDAKPNMKTLDELIIELNRVGNGATLAAILRAVARMKRQGGADLIGQECFDIESLFMQENGRGVINILAAEKLALNPVAYSTLMIWILSELFERLPEAGDLEKPKMILFIDEAHLLFNDASPVFLQKIETAIRLIRSKGVGVYFVTQSPDDLPAPILGQLGNRIQHALRGATQRDLKAIKAAAETMPINPKLDAAAAIARLGVGQALVSFIGEDSRPTPVELIRVSLPDSRLGSITPAERAQHFEAVPVMAQPMQKQSNGIGGQLALVAFGLACFVIAVLIG